MLLRLDQPGMEDAPLDPIPVAEWSLRTNTNYLEESKRHRDPCERRRMALMSEGGIAAGGKIDQWRGPLAEITMGRVMREENREAKRSKREGKDND
ncbi:hypothetical protein PUN28_003517 [Cardiocondyla obscurior]|uniref:Uncharacterized protein n=1 Tax=Cardiocondyla obscurior TaxID=286306 RepID=A0AAW2GL95_9HYME